MSESLLANPWAAHALVVLFEVLVFPLGLVFLLVLPAVAYTRRRVQALAQGRQGSVRAGPLGLLQPLADLGKLLASEDTVPAQVDRDLFLLAPALVLVPVLVAFGPLPFGPGVALPGGVVAPAAPSAANPMGLTLLPLAVADLDAGLLFVLAMASVAVLGVSVAGWSSNSKYAHLGGVRAIAQRISCEVGLVFSVLGVLVLDQTLRLSAIVESQVTGVWHLIDQPLGFLLFLVGVSLAAARPPFDHPGCEDELAGGYHLEYSGARLATLRLAEHAALLLAASLVTCLFLGGWDIPLWDLRAAWQVAVAAGDWSTTWWLALAGLVAFLVKAGLVVIGMTAVRGALPRLRPDQGMDLGWRVLLPLGVVNLFLTALVEVVFLAGS